MFTIRVYGIMINEENQILLSDEYIRGGYYTKFPGGGLEQGEGTRDCVKREFKEEMDLDIEVGAHFYTTDYYQKSAFNPDDQVISIYYYVSPAEPIRFKLRQSKFDFTEDQLKIYNESAEIESFRFIDLKNLSEEDVTLPIDKKVVALIISQK